MWGEEQEEEDWKGLGGREEGCSDGSGGDRPEKASGT